MKVVLKHQPAYAIAYCFLDVGETLHVERDAMALMSDGFDISAGLGGTGVGRALVRKAFGGENLVFGHYTARIHNAFIGVTPKFPGDVATLELDGTAAWSLEQGALVAYEDGVDVDTTYTGLRGVLLKEGISMLRAGGIGTAIVSTYGAVERFTLAEGQTLVVDTGHLVGMTETIDMRVGPLGSVAASALTGEGLVAALTGPGQVLVQTRAEQQLRSWLFPNKSQNG